MAEQAQSSVARLLRNFYHTKPCASHIFFQTVLLAVCHACLLPRGKFQRGYKPKLTRIA